MEGWIKLLRQIIHHPVFRNPKLLQVFIYCLLRANHKAGYRDFFRGKEITLKAGQFITGRFQGAKDCNMKPTTFAYQLNKLRKLGMISMESDNNKSVITVVNWAKFQHTIEESDSLSDSNLTSDCHHSDTDKNERMKEKRGSIRPTERAKKLRKLNSKDEGYL